MQEDARQRFQGKCLQSDEGYLYMRDGFDSFSPRVRQRLRESPFNICCACVYQEADRFMSIQNRDMRYFKAIEDMEEMIRAEA